MVTVDLCPTTVFMVHGVIKLVGMMEDRSFCTIHHTFFSRLFVWHST